MPHAASHPNLQDCIQECLRCYQMCRQMAMTHCLQLGGRHLEPEHFRLLTSCAESCRAAADLMLSDSPVYAPICAACAEVCDACAESCDQVGDMDNCARVCRSCAQSCRDTAGPIQIMSVEKGRPTDTSTRPHA